jgi:clan AA aspartic protease
LSVFEQVIGVSGPQQDSWEEVSALVDTGSIYTVLPTLLLQRLGVVPTERRRFRIADNSVMERDVGEVLVRIDQRVKATPVVFGGVDSPLLLGAVTLEEFGLGVDPMNKRLIPVEGVLMSNAFEHSCFAESDILV